MNYQCFVYSGGKCGSSTLTNTLVNNGFDCVLHVHNNCQYNYVYRDIVKMTGCETVEALIKSQSNLSIYVFDSYRDPIERLVSSFFPKY